MFVAIDEENKQVFGPFTDEQKGEEWALAYLKTVEGVDVAAEALRWFGVRSPGSMVLVDHLWNVQEVQFVDEDDRTFEAFLHTAATIEANLVRGDLSDLEET